MQLVVDIGNTRSKIALFRETEMVNQMVVKPEDLRFVLADLQEAHGTINNAMVGATGEIPQQVIENLEQVCPTLILDHTHKTPFVNDYSTPNTLGVDRIALISAAAVQYPEKNTLVIDAGTCVTFDFLDAQNHYKGGAISPGLQMRYKALNVQTAKLPLLEIEPPEGLIGNSTAGSIHSGVVYGLVNEIEGAIERYKEQFPDLTVILTGGDTHFLLEYLKNGIFANSNFLLEGLSHLLTLNIADD